jgi:cell division septum initiation protein DivIVA
VDDAETPKLPVSFRGYDLDATDALLRQLEAGFRTLLAERDRVEGRVAELERELAEHRDQSQAVGNALIRVEELKALSERDARETKEDAEREAGEIRVQAEQDAEALRATVDAEVSEMRATARREAEGAVREAEARAARLIADVERQLQERQHEAEDFLDDTRERLSSLVRDLFGRVTRRSGDGAGTEEFAPESAFDSRLDRDSSGGA